MLKYMRCFFWLGIVIATACSTIPSYASITPTVSPSKTVIPTPTKTVFPTVTPHPTFKTATPTLPPLNCATVESDLPKISSGEYRDWCKYTNTEYGFSLAIPSHWSVCSRSENFIVVCPQLTPNVGVTIGFRHATEYTVIQRTGVGAGDVITQRTVNFLGQPISRDVLIYQEKTKSVLYNNAVETQNGDLIFTLSLDDWSGDYKAVSLSQEIQDTADKIVGSVELE